MEKSEVLRINKKHKSIQKDKNEKNRNKKSLKMASSQTHDNETQLPNSIIPGSSEIQGINALQSMPGISNKQDVAQFTQSQNINNPQQMVPYQAPAIINNIPAQIVPIQNQISPSQLIPLDLGSGQAQLICPYCNTYIMSKLEKSFNCFSCCLCCFQIAITPCLLLCLAASASGGDCKCSDCDCSCCRSEKCNGKCCYDINHYCPNCGKMIGTRDAVKVVCPCIKRCLP